MGEHPIMFRPEMVRAYQEGRKIQTRRPIKIGDIAPSELHGWKPSPSEGNVWRCYRTPRGPGGGVPSTYYWRCPYGQPGDVLRLKEALVRRRIVDVAGQPEVVCYEADNTFAYWDPDQGPVLWRWKRDRLPAMFMPTWACRYRPLLTSVRVERVQKISRADFFAEGGTRGRDNPCREHGYKIGGWWNPILYKSAFGALWDSIHGCGAWDRNDCVWVLGMGQ